jgi:hypothetical protein
MGRGSGYALANKGQDTRAMHSWLGHKSITGTAVIQARVQGGIGAWSILAIFHSPAGVRA